MTRLNNLKNIKPLTVQTDKGAIKAVQLVKGFPQSMAYTEGEHIAALSMNKSNLETLELGEEAAFLEYLCLSGHKSLKKVVFETALPCLTHLYLDNCGLTEIRIPAGCKALKQIYLQGNGLIEVVFEGDCPALELLDMGYNQLTALHLPKGFRQLQYLYLNDNRIKTLSFTSNLRRLTILHLNNNGLIKLPTNFLALTGLETLYLHNSPVPNLPPNIIAKDKDQSSLHAVRAYLQEYDKGTITNERAKLIIVGNGRVGKTSMYRRLKNEDFDKNEKYTHGIYIGDLEKVHIPEVETKKLELKVWDFGGQEIFFATHQFFLSKEAIYILAWTNEKNVLAHRERDKTILPFDEKWRDYAYWLDNIRLHGGEDSPILMVQTNSDCRAHKLIPESYCSEAPYKAELLDFSAENKRGLEDVKEYIADKLNKVIPLFGKEFPATYDAVIDAVEELTEKSISLKAFYTICKKAKISKGNELEVLDYLQKTGLVVYFDKPLLKNVVFTDPNWLTQEVYRLINNDLREKKGEINETYLEEILRGYSPMQRNQFVELLKNFELIFEADDENKKLYIAPQYLPDTLDGKTQTLYKILFKGLSRMFIFRFPKFMPDNIMINFLSRYGPFSERLYWKNGIFFTNERDVQCSVVYDEKDQSLSVYTSKSVESLDLQYEICQAFVELSKNTRAEISVDGKAFALWQTLKKHGELYEKDPNHQFFAVDGVTHLYVKDFAPFLGKENMHRHFGKEKNINEPIENKEMNSQEAQVRDFIAKAKTDDAIKVIQVWAAANANLRAQTDIALIASDWATLRREINTGTAENENNRRNKINKQILTFDWTSESPIEPTPIIKEEEKPPKTEEPKAPPISQATKMLFLGSNPLKQKSLQLQREYYEISERLRKDKQASDKFEMDNKMFTRRRDFMDSINEFKPNIIHFAGHGKASDEVTAALSRAIGIDSWVDDGGLIFHDKDYQDTELVSAEDLEGFFENFVVNRKIPIEIVVLNACYSATQAAAIAKHVKYVIGMRNTILDDDGIEFSYAFYGCLARGESVIQAFNDGKALIGAAKAKKILTLWVDNKEI